MNDQQVFEYDRTTKLDDRQMEFLDRMDDGMSRGIRVYGHLITAPDVKQKATFVAMNLLKALQQEDQTRAVVSCAYLSTRLPHVVEVQARDQDDQIYIEFIEEH